MGINNVWEFIIIVIVVMSLTIHLAKHGEEKPYNKYDFGTMLLASAINITVLYLAGLFR